jgi:hypothetical protein
MSRQSSDFTINVFASASHLMLEATVASDEELERLQRMVPGFYEFVSNWIWGRVRRQRQST